MSYHLNTKLAPPCSCSSITVVRRSSPARRPASARGSRELAARGMTVVLASRATETLERLADELHSKYGVATYVLTLDLARTNAASIAKAFCDERKLHIDLLVNNAGFMTYGLDESIDPLEEQAEIQVNVASLAGLTHAFLPGMLERRRGGIINVSSLAGFQPIPYMAVYAATKAFVISYSVALDEECRTRNVRVSALCPGTTATEMYEHAHAEHDSAGTPRSVEQVVATGLRGWENGKTVAVDGWWNRLRSVAVRLVPRWYAARLAGRIVAPYDRRKRAPMG
ncbi:MAG: SDR family oxidoreductase [Pirellulales bacterium]